MQISRLVSLFLACLCTVLKIEAALHSGSPLGSITSADSTKTSKVSKAHGTIIRQDSRRSNKPGLREGRLPGVARSAQSHRLMGSGRLVSAMTAKKEETAKEVTSAAQAQQIPYASFVSVATAETPEATGTAQTVQQPAATTVQQPTAQTAGATGAVQTVGATGATQVAGATGAVQPPVTTVQQPAVPTAQQPAETPATAQTAGATGAVQPAVTTVQQPAVTPAQQPAVTPATAQTAGATGSVQPAVTTVQQPAATPAQQPAETTAAAQTAGATGAVPPAVQQPAGATGAAVQPAGTTATAQTAGATVPVQTGATVAGAVPPAETPPAPPAEAAPPASDAGSAGGGGVLGIPTGAGGDSDSGLSFFIGSLVVMLMVGGLGYTAWFVYQSNPELRNRISALLGGTRAQTMTSSRMDNLHGAANTGDASESAGRGTVSAGTANTGDSDWKDGGKDSKEGYRRSVLQARQNVQSESDEDVPPQQQSKTSRASEVSKADKDSTGGAVASSRSTKSRFRSQAPGQQG